MRLMRISRRVRKPWAWRAYWARNLRARSATTVLLEETLVVFGCTRHTLKLQIVHKSLFLGLCDVRSPFCHHCRVGSRDEGRHVGSFWCLLSLCMDMRVYVGAVLELDGWMEYACSRNGDV